MSGFREHIGISYSYDFLYMCGIVLVTVSSSQFCVILLFTVRFHDSTASPRPFPVSVLPEEAQEALRKGKAEGDQGLFFVFLHANMMPI